MRILQVGPVPRTAGGRSTGGVAAQTWELAVRLSAAGHDVAVIASNIGFRGSVMREGVRIFGTPVPAWHVLKSVLPYRTQLAELYRRAARVSGTIAPLRYFAATRTVLEKFTPDIIHVHHLLARYTCTYWAAPADLPVIATVHSHTSVTYGEKAALYRQLVRENAADKTPLIFVSEEVMEEFTRQIGDKSGRKYLLPNALDSEFFKPLPRRAARVELGFPHRPTLAFIGSPLGHKGAFLLARAAAKLVQQGYDLHLAIAGDDPEAAEFRSLLIDLRLLERTTWRRHIDRELLSRWYSAADLFVMPSRGESFGLVYLESAACGTPVVALDGSAPHIVIPNGKVGLLAPDNSPQVLAATIKQALQTSWDRELLVAHAKRFDWAKRLPQFMSVYRETIDSHDPEADPRYRAEV